MLLGIDGHRQRADGRPQNRDAYRFVPAAQSSREAGFPVSAAIGIAIEEPGRDGTNLVQGADAAMQRVKGRGGNAFEWSD